MVHTQQVKRLERFRLALGVKVKDAAYQVSSLIHTMGDKANDILTSLQLDDAKLNDYHEVNKSFDGYFIGVHNVIYECASLINRKLVNQLRPLSQ